MTRGLLTEAFSEAAKLSARQDAFARWILAAVEHRPADVVAQPLIVQDQLADRLRQLVALPAALAPAGPLALAFRRRRARRLDRVGGGSELVRGDVGDRRRLPGSIRGMARRAAQIPGRRHRMARRRAGLDHRDLAAHPGPRLLNSVTRARVRRLRRLEEGQDVLRARGGPRGEQVMVGIRERPPRRMVIKRGSRSLGRIMRPLS